MSALFRTSLTEATKREGYALRMAIVGLGAMALSLGYRESGDGSTSAVRGESSLGAPRLDGELLKLGVDISQGSVAKYLVRK